MSMDQVLHFVECDYGKLGKSFIERTPEEASLVQTVKDIASGQIGATVTRVLGVCFWRRTTDQTSSVGRLLFDHFNYSGKPFGEAPATARDLMIRAGYDIDAIDRENETNDREFARSLNQTAA